MSSLELVQSRSCVDQQQPLGNGLARRRSGTPSLSTKPFRAPEPRSSPERDDAATSRWPGGSSCSMWISAGPPVTSKTRSSRRSPSARSRTRCSVGVARGRMSCVSSNSWWASRSRRRAVLLRRQRVAAGRRCPELPVLGAVVAGRCRRSRAELAASSREARRELVAGAEQRVVDRDAVALLVDSSPSPADSGPSIAGAQLAAEVAERVRCRTARGDRSRGSRSRRARSWSTSLSSRCARRRTRRAARSASE